MNKKGFTPTLFYFLMLGIVIIILGIALASPTKQVIDDSLTGLTCTAPANDFDQATCWFLDILKFTTIGGILAVGVYLLMKFK